MKDLCQCTVQAVYLVVVCEGFVSVHSASCVPVGSLCEGFVSVHSASCVPVGSLCQGFVSVHSASCELVW